MEISISTSGGDPADIVLLPGRAAWMPATRTLLVADLHLGKAATFRRAGIPVPEGSAQRDLGRLARLVGQTAARRLVVLGDLFHARSGCTGQVCAEFAATRRGLGDVEVVLVPGNHDRALGRLPAEMGIDAVPESLAEPPFHFVHEPDTPPPAGCGEVFTLAGHVHPTVSIRAPSGDSIRERCFVGRTSLLILPAFGSFTGGGRVAPAEGVRVWFARDDAVVDVTRAAWLTARGRR